MTYHVAARTLLSTDIMTITHQTHNTKVQWFNVLDQHLGGEVALEDIALIGEPVVRHGEVKPGDSVFVALGRGPNSFADKLFPEGGEANSKLDISIAFTRSHSTFARFLSSH
jgi:hypothetical protein